MKKNLTDKEIAEEFGVRDLFNETDKPKKDGFFNQIRELYGNLGGDTQKKIKSAFDAINKLRKKEVNILIVGASGSGKSETINALLKDAKITDQVAIAKKGSDSVTMDINSFKIGSCTVFDSPGLGDLTKNEEQHIKKIKNKILEADKNGNLLIDLVIVILNGGNLRDKKVWQQLINEVLIPNMQDPHNLIIAINKIDLFDDGDHWDKKNNKPTKRLRDNIEEEIKSVKIQIKEATKIDVAPIYYSAGRKDRNKKPWNLVALYGEMNRKAPKEKKISIAATISSKKENFENGDDVDKSFANIKDDLITTVLNDTNNIDNDTDRKIPIGAANSKPNKKHKKKKKEEKKETIAKKEESSGWLGHLIGGAISIFTSFFSW